MRIARASLLLCVLAAWPMASQAQSWDNSGNNLLQGTYYFRQVIYVPDSANDGGLSDAISIYGNISFDGNGNYTISNSNVADYQVDVQNNQLGTVPLACYLNNNASGCAAATVPGTYSIAASGFGFFSSPIASITTQFLAGGDVVYGTVSNGILIASSTETSYSYNDLFIAAPVGPQSPNFLGTYTMAAYFPGVTAPSSAADAFFQINSNGGGSLGTVNITGYYGGGGATTISQSSSNVTYKANNGAAVVTFPTSSTANFYSGQVYLYFSPDGKFCFGGSPYTWDMIVGVRNDSSTYNSGPIYYAAGLDLNVSTLASAGTAAFDSFYGSFSSTNGSIIEADRLLYQGYAPSVSTYGDSTSDTAFAQFAFGNGGTVRIGAGKGPYLGLSVAVQAPKSPGSAGQTVYLDPTSLQNAASYAPFTAGVSPGELIILYGANLAASPMVAPPGGFPTYLGGVQVIVNGIAAPLYYVKAGQLAAIIPYETGSATVAQIQVNNNNVMSNTITAYVNQSSAGLFTQSQNGQAQPLGYAAAVHNADGSLVTPTNPAQPGEYIAVFVTGLGAVFPTIQDGAVGPTNPLSPATACPTPPTGCTITASINNVAATIVYAGLAPTLAGLYQIDLQIPSTGLTGGNQTLSVCGTDSCTAESLISIGGGLSAMAREAPAADFPRKNPRTTAIRKPLSLRFGNRSLTVTAQ